MQSVDSSDLLEELSEIKIALVDVWMHRKHSEYNWGRLQMLLDFQKQIANDLMDMGYPLNELNLFVPMDENLA